MRAFAGAGVDFFQLRDQRATDAEYERFLTDLGDEAPETLPRVLVNDRLALAASFPVAGVHLPEAGLPVRDVRSRYPRGRLLVGRSVHGASAATQAVREGADYLILGPIHETGGKRPLPPGSLREIAGCVSVPVWAIGGLTAENLDGLQGVGVSGMAAIRAFRDPPAAAAFVASVRRQFHGPPPPG